MKITLLDYDLRILNLRTRMPFRYGIAELTAVPHLLVHVTLEVNGQRGTGIAADSLAPKWFTKNPEEPYEHELAAMLEVIAHAFEVSRNLAVTSPFELWYAVYQAQSEWAQGTSYPPLLWNFGVTLVERAVLDAFCRITRCTFAQALRQNTLGIALSVLYPELAGASPADLLPPERRRLIIRHTVGLSDPLVDGDIARTDIVNDGLPQSLQAAIAGYGLTHFKIKLCGDVDRDFLRLGEIANLLESAPPWRFTLDGNEQFACVDEFRNLWSRLCADDRLSAFLQHLLFVEQPFHRASALSDSVRNEMIAWRDRPAMIIDESDATIASLSRALECGYVGTSHKNCKGVFKSIASAAMIEHLRREHPDRAFIQSAEDLSNIGPVALLQDLAVVAALGIEHVERNGHHYFRGLSMWPADVQANVLERHADLYGLHPRGFPTLSVSQGRIDVDSVVDAPFGIGFELDTTRFTPLADWRIESLART